MNFIIKASLLEISQCSKIKAHTLFARRHKQSHTHACDRVVEAKENNRFHNRYVRLCCYVLPCRWWRTTLWACCRLSRWQSGRRWTAGTWSHDHRGLLTPAKTFKDNQFTFTSQTDAVEPRRCVRYHGFPCVPLPPVGLYAMLSNVGRFPLTDCSTWSPVTRRRALWYTCRGEGVKEEDIFQKWGVQSLPSPRRCAY